MMYAWRNVLEVNMLTQTKYAEKIAQEDILLTDNIALNAIYPVHSVMELKPTIVFHANF